MLRSSTRVFRLRSQEIRAWPLVLAVILVAACRSEPPSDEAMIKQFKGNAQHYAQLVAMLLEDPKVGTIGADWVFAVRSFERTDATGVGIADDRLDEYQRLIALIGAIRVDRSGQEIVSFMTWGSGFAGNTHHKGIAWLTSPPPASTDRRLVHIQENWYLYQD